uniref:Uncharacterized protein n=1 Tax=Arundo donax TaxID=35708 RepID=A0A0A9BWK3_ARUDO
MASLSSTVLDRGPPSATCVTSPGQMSPL